MSYQLGIDLGTTYTAAAVRRGDVVQMVALGTHESVVPSVLWFGPDGEMLVGDAANRRAIGEPERVAREFKRRIGDAVPIFVAGAPHAPERLYTRMLRWVVDEVTQLEGGPPDRIALTHPANWGQYRRELLEQALSSLDLPPVEFITEPEAAAIHYASQTRVADGALFAVYDLGGGTFDAVVLRKRPVGWEIVGSPDGIDNYGGIDFDAAIFSRVQEVLDVDPDWLDEDDPNVVAAMSRLRFDCVEAKEALSNDTATSIPVFLASSRTEIRLTRVEFEAMLRPGLADTIDVLSSVVRGAGLAPEDLDHVLLIGGSSRIPLVAELVGSQFGRPVAVDAHPKHAVALGAARAAGQSHAVPPSGDPTPPVTQQPPPAQPPPAQSPPRQPPAQQPPPVTSPPPTPPQVPPQPVADQPAVLPPQGPAQPPAAVGPPTPNRSWLGWLIAGAAVLLVVVVGFIALRPDDSGDEPTTTAGASPTDSPTDADQPAATPDSDQPSPTAAPTPDDGAAPADLDVFAPVAWPAGDAGWTSAGSTSLVDPPELLWSSSLPLGAAPVVHDGVLYGGFDDGTVRAFDASDGTELWIFDNRFTPSQVQLVEAFDGQLVVVADAFTDVVFIGAADGVEFARWSAPEDLAEQGTVWYPTIVDGALLIVLNGTGADDGSVSSSVVAVDLSDASGGWRYDFDSSGNQFAQPPVIADGVVTVAKDHVVGLDLATGSVLWTHTPIERAPISSLATDGVVVFHDGRLKGLDLATGEVVWIGDTSAFGIHSARDGVLYTVSSDGLLARDVTTGEATWAVDLPRELFDRGLTAVAGDQVLTVAATLEGDNELLAYSRSDGSLLWRQVLPGFEPAFDEPLGVTDGRLYIVDEAGILHALG